MPGRCSINTDRQGGTRARRRFGQNFLIDPGVIERIVDTLGPAPGQRLLEIGPGRGALTLPVLARCARLGAVELDRDLIDNLRRASAGTGELLLLQGDALSLTAADLSALLGREGPPLRIFGNLPYNISTPLLFRLLSLALPVGDMLFMLQREVVARLAAVPGSGTYGRLTVMAACQCQVEALFTVPPEAFEPAPRVTSQLVRLVPLASSGGDEQAAALHDALSRLTATAFAKRRKTLRNALRGLLDESALEAANIDPGQRPESISPEGYLLLAKLLRDRQANGDR